MASKLQDAAADALELLRDLRKPGVPDPDLDALVERLDEALAEGAAEFTRARDAAARVVESFRKEAAE